MVILKLKHLILILLAIAWAPRSQGLDCGMKVPQTRGLSELSKFAEKGPDIVVVGKSQDPCRLNSIRDHLASDREFSEIFERRTTNCLSQGCNPNYEIALSGSGSIPVDKPAGILTLLVQGAFAECPHCSLKTGPSFGQGDTVSSEHGYEKKFQLSPGVILDARDEEIEISCPIETCEGIQIGTSELSNRLRRNSQKNFFVLTTKSANGDRVTKLIVNAGEGSRFTTKSGIKNDYRVCPAFKK